jgi:hypothetical protein
MKVVINCVFHIRILYAFQKIQLKITIKTLFELELIEIIMLIDGKLRLIIYNALSNRIRLVKEAVI